ncbi:ABC transporter permease [Paenibacillus hodogayensis]|uniref:ABC transporter permease n=1 Tax=Paenibacillus hodogayensis TaxID=279208 RepID=A0ABV5VST8_9BACL
MNAFTGTLRHIRLFLRRERWMIFLWIGLGILIPQSTVSSAAAFLATGGSLEEFANEMAGNPVVRALLGSVHSETLGGIVAWRSSGQMVILFALFSILTVIRHTRAEEEAGRRELLLSAPIGKLAAPTAILIVVCGIEAIIGVLIATTLSGNGVMFSESLLMGLTMAAAGWVFAAIALLCGEWSRSSSGARGLAFTSLGIQLLVQMINNGNGGYTPLKWLTPMAWNRISLPFAENRWIFLLYPIVIAVLISSCAFWFCLKRDLGSGIYQGREPQLNKSYPRTPLALAWRQQRGLFVSWVVAIALTGDAVGMVAASVMDVPGMDVLNQLGDYGWMNQMAGADAFISIFVYALCFAFPIYGILSVQKMRVEETEQRAELLLSLPVSRNEFIQSHLVFSFGGMAVILLAFGISLGLGYGWASGESQVWRMLITCMAKLPAIWLFTGVAVMLYGFIPKISALGSFGVLGLVAALELLWESHFIGWEWLSLSPLAYVHYSKVFVGTFPLLATIVLTIITGILAIAGSWKFRKREII